MNAIQFIISGLIAVIMMTLFSHTIGKLTGNTFSEPTLLSEIIKKKFTNFSKFNSALLKGWIFHFILGFIFLGLYEVFWWYFNVNRDLFYSVLLGIASGLLGVLGWKIMFKSANFKKDFNYSYYYIQLIFAHIIFSMTALFVHLNFN